MQRGHVRLWRKIKDHPYWKEKRIFSRAEAWIDLFMSAAGKDKKVIFRGEDVFLKRGQLIISERNLSEKWGWSRERVRRFIKNCLKNDEIRYHRKDHRITIINIVNYGKYNHLKEYNETTDETTDETMTNKEIIKNKESKNIYVEKWNNFAEENNLSKVQEIKSGSSREKHLKARIKDGMDFDDLLRKVERQPFLLGENKDNWSVTFDWIILPSNYQKIMEEQYKKREPKEVSSWAESRKKMEMEDPF
ncbi:MAG: hypothetical protein OEY25_03770 [Candidatus Aminicenantes bacterium]|nr:hypothetical protein [Candidatus Aminicenantes bacterium]MDH5705041.1 hypothetical protein [Candidatus Aminicenantes bacterium]